MRISTKKVRNFQNKYPNLWHEGLSEDQVKEIKSHAEGKYKGLLRKFYWPKGKSYVIQYILGDDVYCISKKYYERSSS